jgi:outer membrane protein assembly factor BamB
MCLDAEGLANGNDGPYRMEGAHMDPKLVWLASSNTPLPVAEQKLCDVADPPGPQDADILWLFELTSGTGIWSHDSAHSSILIEGHFLYLNTGTGVDNTHRKIRTPDAPGLVVLDKRTGRLVARDNEKTAPNIFHCTWSAPSMAEVNGRPLLFFAGGNGIIYGFEPLGKVAMPAPTGLAFAGAGPAAESSAPSPQNYNTAALPAPDPPAFLKKVFQFDFDPEAPKTNVHKFNSNRRESPSNFFGMPVFHENRLYVAGGGDIWWGKNEAWVKCIDATRTGDTTAQALVWSAPLNKHVMATPAVAAGLVFIVDCPGTLHCLDAATGQSCWTEQLKGDGWASPFVADGKLYLGTRSGEFYVFAAAREKKLLSSLSLGSPVSATVNAANGVLYVAAMNRLFALRKDEP